MNSRARLFFLVLILLGMLLLPGYDGGVYAGAQSNSNLVAAISSSTPRSVTAGSPDAVKRASANEFCFSDQSLCVYVDGPDLSEYNPPNEFELPIGSTIQIQFDIGVADFKAIAFDYQAAMSVTGLPKGVTASLSPASFQIPLPTGSSDQSDVDVTLTLRSAADAPVTQNAAVTLIATVTGTPTIRPNQIPLPFLVDITQPPNTLPTSRTDFVSTAGTPYAAAYDRVHDLIFASNSDWNRVDVLSNRTHRIAKSIPVRAPRGLDITPDNRHVWVQAASQYVYEIDTSTLHAETYSLPNQTFGSSGAPAKYATDRILALSDGTLFLYYSDAGAAKNADAGVWNPKTNELNVLSREPAAAWGAPMRSLDGKHVFATYRTTSDAIAEYDTDSQKVTTTGIAKLFGNVLAVNPDGTRLILPTPHGYVLYDQQLDSLGTLPDTAGNYYLPQGGGAVFSSHGARIYGIGLPGFINLGCPSGNKCSYPALVSVFTIDTSTLKLLAAAPAAPVGQLTGLPTDFYKVGYPSNATPFAVDASGMVFGLQQYGISFDDSTFAQHNAHPQLMNFPFNGSLGPYQVLSGPLAGGTASQFDNNWPGGFALPPNVWFGRLRGSVAIDPATYYLDTVSPPSHTPGPVNVKFNFPNGIQLFYPDGFTYSVDPQYAVTSGSSPQGGAAAEVIGFGLPLDASGGSLLVGGQVATITTTNAPFGDLSGEPYPSTVLDYIFPPGSPGWADLEIESPSGTGLLPKSVFYAKSVTDYASRDAFTAVLADPPRNRVYLSAGDHVDVFDTASHQFLSPLHPAALSKRKQFTGLALTPDGSELLVADLADGSQAVIELDAHAKTYAIPIAPARTVHSCAIGPLYVAATSNHEAFVTTGALPASNCSPRGSAYIANLQTRAVSLSTCSKGFSVDATADGDSVAIGGSNCVYSVKNSTYTTEPFPSVAGARFGYYGIAISGDGNVVGMFPSLDDTNGDILGSVAAPYPLYPRPNSNAIDYGEGYAKGVVPPKPLFYPRLNASGSLYYLAFPDHFEIVDVAHGLQRLHFALTESVLNTVAPMAIDSGGRFVYLITDKGLTEVDLGAAPLSIGHLSVVSASPGTKVQVRGSGFASGMTAKVGGVAAEVEVTNQNTLTLTVPDAAGGPQDIVLTTSDGEVYTLENGITVL
jgi:hypothetical protein